MYHTNLYSLVIRPPDWIIALVRDMKLQLRDYIGWYSSCNSDAHLTILEFRDDAELSLYLARIEAFCRQNSNQTFHFSSFSFFGESTFFIAPDLDSRTRLTSFIIEFYNHLGIKSQFSPHITIGRQLHKRDQMARTQAFFANAKVDFSFVCENFTLRKFNQTTKQYSDIDRIFPLLNEE